MEDVKTTLAKNITELRTAKGMTQLELAEKIGITDKAVSKWERDLSVPDVATLPKLAEIFGITVDELMQANMSDKKERDKQNPKELINLIFKTVALAMGIAVVVLSIMESIELNSAVLMLGIGLACMGVSQFNK